MLPLNPTTDMAGDSPYFSDSSRAGNVLLISLEDLARDGLLDPVQLAPPLAQSAGRVDFALARQCKLPLLRAAAARAASGPAPDPAFAGFCAAEADWLDDHALFTALREAHHGDWQQWPAPLKHREPAALERARAELRDHIEREQWLQYFFHRQWQGLRRHCREAGVWLFGDLPIYVSLGSVDVWSSPSVFKLDDQLQPVAESGVPPDYFSATGQLWRNPVYDWRALQADGFAWWRRRVGATLRRFDLVRIDHFRGLVQYWEVPAGAENAIHGSWQDVPATALFDALCEHFPALPVVAEDLGTITPDVHEIRDRYGFPGMVVLQFAFGSDDPHNPYRPENHRENAVAYLGTHDNNTVRGWYDSELDAEAYGRLAAYLPDSGDDAVRAAIELLLSSAARTAILSAQDLLGLGAEARMNTPGIADGNWCWQLSDPQYAALPWTWLAERCAVHGRNP